MKIEKNNNLNEDTEYGITDGYKQEEETEDQVKLPRALRKGSTGWAMLEYGFVFPAFTHGDLYKAISYRGDYAIAKAIQHLKERNFIERLSPPNVSSTSALYRISEDGLLYLCRRSDYYKTNSDQYTPVTEKRGMDLRPRLNLYAFIHGAGIRVRPIQKPDFATFVNLTSPSSVYQKEIPRSPLYRPCGQEEISGLLDDGIFYTMKEIRDGLEVIGQVTDTFKTSRCGGVVFTGKNIYMTYHTEAKSIVLVKYNEEQLLKKITDLFYGRLNWIRDPICVCTGKTWQMTATISTGYQNGKMAYEKKHSIEFHKKLEGLNTKERETLIEAEEIRKMKAKRAAANKRRHAAEEDVKGARKMYFNAVDDQMYKEIYYIRNAKSQVSALAELFEYDGDCRKRKEIEWFSTHEGFGYKGDQKSIAEGESYLSKTRAIYLPFLDCKILHELEESIEPISVVTYPEHADTIARCIKTRAADLYDLDTGKKITGWERYDEFGYQLSGNQIRNLTEATKKRKELSESRPKTKRYQVAVVQEEPIVSLLKDYRRIYELSETKILEQLIRYVTDNEERFLEFKEYLERLTETSFDGKRFLQTSTTTRIGLDATEENE